MLVMRNHAFLVQEIGGTIMKKFIVVFIGIMILLGGSIFYSSVKNKENIDPQAIKIWMPSGLEILKKKDINNIEMIQELEKRTNTNLHFFGVSGDISSSFNTLMASPMEMNMIYYNWTDSQLKSSYDNGIIIDLTPYIEKYMPNLKARFAENSVLYQYSSPGGKCYYFPAVVKNNYSDIVLAMRSDWIKQTNIGKIETLQDYLKVMLEQKKLFNEKKLINQSDFYLGLSGYQNYIDILMNAFNTSSSIYWNSEKTKLIYGPASNEFREYLKFLKSLAKQNLLDPTNFDNNQVDFEKYFLNSESASIIVPYDEAVKLEKYSIANKDNISLEFLPLLANLNNYNQKYSNVKVLNSGWVITSNTSEEDRIKLVKMIDYLYSDEGIELMNWGVLNKTFTEDKGIKKFKPDILGNDEVYQVAISDHVKGDLIYSDNNVSYSMLDEQGKKIINENRFKKDYSFIEPRGYYTKEEQEELSDLKTAINTFMEETTMNFILKDIDPNNDEQWKEYVDTLNKMGLPRYLQIEMDAWKRMNGNRYKAAKY